MMSVGVCRDGRIGVVGGGGEGFFMVGGGRGGGGGGEEAKWREEGVFGGSMGQKTVCDSKYIDIVPDMG